MRRARPGGGRAAQQRDEISALQAAHELLRLVVTRKDTIARRLDATELPTLPACRTPRNRSLGQI
jgi:hypothetical protein